MATMCRASFGQGDSEQRRRTYPRPFGLGGVRGKSTDGRPCRTPLAAPSRTASSTLPSIWQQQRSSSLCSNCATMLTSPRLPAGNPAGGQWTGTTSPPGSAARGSSGATRVAQGMGRQTFSGYLVRQNYLRDQDVSKCTCYDSRADYRFVVTRDGKWCPAIWAAIICKKLGHSVTDSLSF